jgi:ribosome-binding protein aMBF1 (putative translation factor)
MTHLFYVTPTQDKIPKGQIALCGRMTKRARKIPPQGTFKTVCIECAKRLGTTPVKNW